MTVFQRVHFGEHVYESTKDAIAAAGTTQATAFKLPFVELCRLTTVAVGSGVMLPPARGGLSLVVLNHGANAVQVYGQPGDKINDIASTSGVLQMQNSWVIYTCFAVNSGWYTADMAAGFSSVPGDFATTATSAITSSTTHTQAGATLILTMNVAVTNANAADAVLLPAAQVGMQVTVVNLSATNAMQVYASGTDTINGTAGATGVSQAASAVTIYYCFVAGAWLSK